MASSTMFTHPPLFPHTSVFFFFAHVCVCSSAAALTSRLVLLNFTPFFYHHKKKKPQPLSPFRCPQKRTYRCKYTLPSSKGKLKKKKNIKANKGHDSVAPSYVGAAVRFSNISFDFHLACDSLVRIPCLSFFFLSHYFSKHTHLPTPCFSLLNALTRRERECICVPFVASFFLIQPLPSKKLATRHLFLPLLYLLHSFSRCPRRDYIVKYTFVIVGPFCP